MLNGKRVMVVMPAYRAGKTLKTTWEALPHDIIDRVLIVDDASDDETVKVAKELGLDLEVHPINKGYGANQKTCYEAALADGADIIVMVHPDYQYEPKLVTAMAAMIESEVYDLVLGSRILGGGALKGGMPIWKYVANRMLTLLENLMLGAKFSEYHTGFRAYSRKILKELNWQNSSDDFVFDNQFLAKAIISKKFKLGEISVPTKYFAEASSINFARSVKYGFGVLQTSFLGLLHRLNIYTANIFK